MKPFLLSLLLLFCFVLACSAQKKDSTHVKITQQVALNSTELFRQFFNLNLSNNNAVSNPYLLSYAIFFNKWGIRASLGYAMQDSTNKDENSNSFSSQNRFTNFRIGPVVKVRLGKRFAVQPGIDITVNATKLVTDNNFSSGSQHTETTTSGWGIGPSCSLLFHVTRHFSIGTEASIYYNSSNTTDKFTSTFNSPITVTSTSKSFKMTMPAAIFLFLNF